MKIPGAVELVERLKVGFSSVFIIAGHLQIFGVCKTSYSVLPIRQV